MLLQRLVLCLVLVLSQVGASPRGHRCRGQGLCWSRTVDKRARASTWTALDTLKVTPAGKFCPALG